MVGLSSVRNSNRAYVQNSPTFHAVSDTAEGPVALFVGATAGIGRGMALLYGQWLKENGGPAQLVVVGRSKDKVDSLRDEINNYNPAKSHSHATKPSDLQVDFVQVDATSPSSVQAACDTVLSRYPKINYLVLSPGYLSLEGFDPVPDKDRIDQNLNIKLDKKLMVHYYARWMFIDRLTPALETAQESGQDAKVFSVLGPGYGGRIDLEDLGLEKGFSSSKVALVAPTYNDLMMESFTKLHPSVTFLHAAPGVVRSSYMTSSRSGALRLISPVANALIYPFSVSTAQCAEWMWSALLNPSFKSRGELIKDGVPDHAKLGAYRIGSKGQNLGDYRYFGNDEWRTKLWEFTTSVVGWTEGRQ